MITIKAVQLPELFEKFKGTSFVGLKTKTTPKLLKKGRVSGKTLLEAVGTDEVVKESAFSAGIGYDYATSVKNKLLKEGKSEDEYEAGETWHIPYNGSKVIRQHRKTGELYFYVSLNTNNPSKAEYFDVKNGTVIPKEVLEEFLPVEKAPTNQGVEEGNEVLVRTLKLGSVASLSACNEVYNVEGE